MRTEAEVWKFINKERKVRKTVCKNITMKNWRPHFMGVLEGGRRENFGGRKEKWG